MFTRYWYGKYLTWDQALVWFHSLTLAKIGPSYQAALKDARTNSEMKHIHRLGLCHAVDSLWGRKIARSPLACMQCRRILSGRNLVRVRNIVVAAIFDFMTAWKIGESRKSNPYAPFDSPRLFLSSRSFNMGLSRANCALKENACTAS